MDISGLNLPVECSDDFWNAFYKENQLEKMDGRSSSESEDLTDELENEQSLENEIFLEDATMMQRDNVGMQSQL